VPDALNLALAPPLQPIMDYTRSATGLVWNQTEARERLSKATAGSGRVMNDRSAVGSVDKGTLTDLEACWRVWQDKGEPVPAGDAREAARHLLAAMQETSAVLDELAQAAAARPQIRFPVEYDWEPASEILLPHLAQLKGLQGALILRGIARLELGANDDAFQDLQLGFRLADALKDEPILISHLVRVALVGRNLQLIREGLHRHAWTAEQLSWLQDRLATLDLLAGNQRAQQGERAMSVGLIDYARRLGPRMRFSVWSGDQTPAPLDLLVGSMPDGWYYQNMLLLAELHEGYGPLIDVQAHRVHPEKSKESEARLERFGKEPTHPGNLFVKMLMPSLGRAVARTARMQSAVDAARVASAIERYRLAEGRLPTTLAALVPDYLRDIPHDIVDGKPLRYLPDDRNGYRLYSLGWNLADDGGTVAWRKQGGSSVDETQGDWVWLLPGDEPAGSGSAR
jgi:hypothetical protein